MSPGRNFGLHGPRVALFTVRYYVAAGLAFERTVRAEDESDAIRRVRAWELGEISVVHVAPGSRLVPR